MKKGIEVISLALAPALVLARLRELTNHPQAGDLNDEGLVSGSWLQGRLNDHLRGIQPLQPTDKAVIMRVGEDIVGWALLSDVIFDRTGCFYERPTVGCNLYVSSFWRRQGIGRCILEASQVAARKSGAEVVLVYPWNRRSRAFFVSQGYRHLTGPDPVATGHWRNVIFSLDIIAEQCNPRAFVVQSA